MARHSKLKGSAQGAMKMTNRDLRVRTAKAEEVKGGVSDPLKVRLPSPPGCVGNDQPQVK